MSRSRKQTAAFAGPHRVHGRRMSRDWAKLRFEAAYQLPGVVPANQAVREVAIFLRLTATAGFAGAQKSSSGCGGLKRLQQRWHSEDVDDPFEIVAQHAQGQFGCR